MTTTAKNKKRYTITVNDDLRKQIETAAKALNVTPTTYVWLCVESRGRLLQENSNLKAKLRDGLVVRVAPPPTFE
jgi:hypothetical protein